MREHEWKRWLAARGIPVPAGVFVSGSDGGAALAALRPPLAVKAVAPAIVHKTEMGAVRLGLPDPVTAQAVMAEMRAALAARGVEPLEGFLVEEMAEAGVELLLGAVTDPTFGRLVAFGQGGTRVEAVGDVCFFAVPLRAGDVDALLATLPWLEPALRRAGPTAGRALREVVMRFAGPDGIATRPEVERLEINPLIVSGRGAVAVDARGALAGAPC